jgi:hypothetical protein
MVIAGANLQRPPGTYRYTRCAHDEMMLDADRSTDQSAPAGEMGQPKRKVIWRATPRMVRELSCFLTSAVTDYVTSEQTIDSYEQRFDQLRNDSFWRPVRSNTSVVKVKVKV